MEQYIVRRRGPDGLTLVTSSGEVVYASPTVTLLAEYLEDTTSVRWGIVVKGDEDGYAYPLPQKDQSAG